MNSTSSNPPETKKDVVKTQKHQNSLDAWAQNIHLRTAHENPSIVPSLEFAHKQIAGDSYVEYVNHVQSKLNNSLS